MHFSFFRGLGGGGGVGRLFEAGRLLTFPTYRMGAYLRWALIRGWALNRINTVISFSILPNGKSRKCNKDLQNYERFVDDT